MSNSEEVVPEVGEIQNKAQNFFEFTDLKVVPSPYPPLCGAIPLEKGKIIPNDSFVCLKIQSDYILAIILGYNPKTLKYSVCDAFPEDKVTKIDVDESALIPLPTTSPEKRSKETTYEINSKVLSLLRIEKEWTSCFYLATVKKQPTDSKGLYQLEFDDESITLDVPEKFIVAAPPNLEIL